MDKNLSRQSCRRLEISGADAATGLHRRPQKTRQLCRQKYPVRPMIYFDYNATAPVMREAREAWLNVTEKIGGNPSSMHQAGTRAAIALADAREKLAAFLGCHPLGHHLDQRRDRGEQHGHAPFRAERSATTGRDLDFRHRTSVRSRFREILFWQARETDSRHARRRGGRGLDHDRNGRQTSRPRRRDGREQRNRRHPAVARNPRDLPGLRSSVFHRRRAVHRQDAVQGTGRLRLRQRRGAQIRRAARRGLFENPASQSHHAAAATAANRKAAGARARKTSRSSRR